LILEDCHLNEIMEKLDASLTAVAQALNLPVNRSLDGAAACHA
jgi:hypothetical protein